MCLLHTSAEYTFVCFLKQTLTSTKKTEAVSFSLLIQMLWAYLLSAALGAGTGYQPLNTDYVKCYCTRNIPGGGSYFHWVFMLVLSSLFPFWLSLKQRLRQN